MDDIITLQIGAATIQMVRPAPAATSGGRVMEVTIRQACRALESAGVLDAVQTTIDALPEPQRKIAQIDWDRATTVRRDNPLVALLGSAIPLTEDQIDDLFLAASQIPD